MICQGVDRLPNHLTSSFGDALPVKSSRMYPNWQLPCRPETLATDVPDAHLLPEYQVPGSIAVAQLTDLSENTISEWKILLHVRVSNWLMANPSTLGGPGVTIELDEAKFGKRKYNKGSYRNGQWVLGAVDRNTGQCFLLPCPNNKRGAPTLLPLIKNGGNSTVLCRASWIVPKLQS